MFFLLDSFTQEHPQLEGGGSGVGIWAAQLF